MADRILQELGFDVSDALRNLNRYDQMLTRVEKGTSSFTTTLKAFNKEGNATVATLNRIASAGKKAQQSLNGVSIPGLGGAGGAPGSRGSGGSPANAQAIANAIRAPFASLPDDVDRLSKRAFESAITRTAEFASRAGLSVQQVQAVQGDFTRNFTGDMNVVADRVADVERKFVRSFNSSSKSLRRFTIDFETFVRIISTQVIVRALNRIETVLTESFRGAIEFERGLAEVQTIASGSLGDLENLADAVKEIALAFNLPLDTVSEGLYQTLSNQVVEAGESIGFLNTAAALAKATVSSLDESVNALSSVMNAFNVDSSQANKVASELFKTVELGRLRLSEIANTLGRVTAAGETLGATRQELLAALSTITRFGVRPSEALTQLSGLLTAFLKPSEKMRETLEHLGFSSGQAAVEANGLAGAVQLVTDAVEGDAASLARLFPNVRGLRGEFILTSDSAHVLTENLRQTEEAAASLIGAKAEVILETNAEKAERTLNEFKVFFTSEFGRGLVSEFVDLSEFIGAENLIDVLRDGEPILRRSLEFFGLMITRLALMQATASRAAVSLNGVTAAAQAQAASQSRLFGGATQFAADAVGAVAVFELARGFAESAGNFIGRQIADSLTENIVEIDRVARESFDEFARAEADKLTEFERFNTQRKQQALQASAEIRRSYRDEFQDIRSESEATSSFLISEVNGIVDAREALASELERRADRDRDQIRDSQERALDFQGKLEERRLRQSLSRVDEERRSIFLLARARETLAKSQRDILSASDDRSFERSIDSLDRGIRLADEAAKLAEQQGDVSAQRAAEFAIQEALERQLRVEQRLQRIREDRAQAAEREADVQRRAVEQLREQARIVAENSGIFDENGSLFPASQRADRAARRQRAIQSIISQTLDSGDLDDIIGALDLSERLQQDLARESVSVNLQAAESSVSRMVNDVQSFLDRVRLRFPAVVQLESATGQQIGSLEDIDRQVSALSDQQVSSEAARSNLRQNAETVRILKEEIEQLVQQIEAPAVLDQAGEDLFRKSRFDFRRLLSQDQINLDQVQAVENEFAALEDRLGSVGRAVLNFADPAAIGNIDLILNKLRELRAQQDTVAEGAAPQLEQNFQSIETTLNRLVSQSDRFAANIERAAQASAQTVPTNRAFGGRFFASGGFHRGIDTLPAMLAPGEFVVNRDASQRFFSDLQRINAGLSPQFRNAGGDVAQVGDVTINVNESSSPRETAREVMAQINRQLRRRVATLN